jgi:hypothetical protein
MFEANGARHQQVPHPEVQLELPLDFVLSQWRQKQMDP